MKTIRSLMTLAGFSLVLFALSATGANAQNITSARFGGTINLPVATQWGAMTLPAGEYTLSYGQAFVGGTYAVAVTGKTDGINHGMVLVKGQNDASTNKDSLVCVREGDTLIVRALEMPELGTAATFALPRGEKLMARNRDHKGYTQLAEAPQLIQQIPVMLNGR